MISDYALWTGGLAVAAGLATFLLLHVWDRQVRREEGAALHLAEMREAAALRAAADEAATAERNRALAEAWAIVLWRASPDGGWREVQGWTALTGQAPGDALGTGWQAMVHPEDLDAVRAAWAPALATAHPLDVEYRVRTAVGGPSGNPWRWCRARACRSRRRTSSLLRAPLRAPLGVGGASRAAPPNGLACWRTWTSAAVPRSAAC